MNWNVTATTNYGTFVLDRLFTTPYGEPTFDTQTQNGDLDGDGVHEPLDLLRLNQCAAGTEPSGTECRLYDLDSDSDVDCDDWTLFTNAWTGSGSPPAFAPCAPAVIPTVSQWGLIVTALVMLTVGTIALGHTHHTVPQTGTIQ